MGGVEDALNGLPEERADDLSTRNATSGRPRGKSAGAARSISTATSWRRCRSTGAPVPPPVPQACYYIAAGGAATGPFGVPALAQMVAAGQLVRESLVWRPGMAEWQPAGGLSDLAVMFSGDAPTLGMPPVPPSR